MYVVQGLPYTASDDLIIAAKMHDIGKPICVSENPKTGFDQFIGHAEKSAEIFRDKASELFGICTPERIDYIAELIKLHDTKYSKCGKIQAMLESHPTGFAADLLSLQLADVLGQSEYQRSEKLQQIKQFAEAIVKFGKPEQVTGVNEVIDSIRKED